MYYIIPNFFSNQENKPLFQTLNDKFQNKFIFSQKIYKHPTK